MDMRLPPGIGPAAAASAKQPPLLLLQRWQPTRPTAQAAAPVSQPGALRAMLRRFFGV